MPLSPAVSAIRKALGTRSVVLVGMMGVGKSTVGKRLSARLQLPFVDTDRAVEEAAQRSVNEIFESYGEEAFRDGERRVIARVLQTPSQVVALGGGAWNNAETRTVVAAKAISIWLDADMAALVERVRRRMSRPLLQNGDAERVLAKLEQERRPIYALADIHLRVRSRPHNQVVDDLMQALSISVSTDRIRSTGV